MIKAIVNKVMRPLSLLGVMLICFGIAKLTYCAVKKAKE